MKKEQGQKLTLRSKARNRQHPKHLKPVRIVNEHVIFQKSAGMVLRPRLDQKSSNKTRPNTIHQIGRIN